MDEKGIILEAVRENFAKSPRAFQIAWRKARNANYDKNREVTADELQRITSYYSQISSPVRVSQKAVREKRVVEVGESKPIHTPAVEVNDSEEEQETRPWYALPGLYFTLAASSIASIYNLLEVSFEISNGVFAVVLTVVLSVAAVVFVASGVRHPFTRGLVIFLIAYEGLCNTVQIYGGLTQWEKGVPTVFLGTITDIFGSGTYATATVIGAFSAAMIAGVQYASIFEINKSKPNDPNRKKRAGIGDGAGNQG